jgi:hypothetical protein
MYALGFNWKYDDKWPTLTTKGFREKLVMTKRGSSDPPTSQPPFSVVSGPCAHTFEARESTLLNALFYIHDICGYKIGDLHFAENIIRRSQTWRWSTWACMNLVCNWTLGLDIWFIIMTCFKLLWFVWTWWIGMVIVIYKLLISSILIYG